MRDDEVAKLVPWIESGGVLIRFAGPRLAAQADDLIPVPLRQGGRALGGTLSWEEPQSLGAFDDASPFAGLTIPADVTVRRQVLAEPSVDLATRTWARLADGTPLVTAVARGQGTHRPLPQSRPTPIGRTSRCRALLRRYARTRRFACRRLRLGAEQRRRTADELGAAPCARRLRRVETTAGNRPPPVALSVAQDPAARPGEPTRLLRPTPTTPSPSIRRTRAKPCKRSAISRRTWGAVPTRTPASSVSARG